VARAGEDGRDSRQAHEGELERRIDLREL
jgi:hypothetical protein